MGMRLTNLLVAFSLVATLVPVKTIAQSPPRMLISAIKTGGAVVGEPTEYVGIYNDSNNTVDLSGWVIEYAKPSANIIDCNAESWRQQDSSANTKEYKLTDTIAPNQTSVFEVAMNDNVGGSLRLKQGSVVWDMVGWGNLMSFGRCKETELAPIPEHTKSIKRAIDTAGMVVDTNNNKQDFLDSIVNDDQNDTVPGVVTDQDDCIQTEDCLDQDNQDAEKCSSMVLSEILPNPAGDDSGNEYIELFNTSATQVDLDGCSLRVGNAIRPLSGKVSPKQYVVLYGMVLPNANGGTVELITGTTEEVVTYPAGLKDDEAWALINDQWLITSRPTVGTENIMVESSIAKVDSGPATVLQPCPLGKYRNPETNRCKNIEPAGTLEPCKSGQVRNPETNRCRSVSDVLTSLKSCDAGQVRNPVTNRCKKVSSSGSLSACKEGQVRNPETNRCRKVAGTTTSAESGTQNKQQPQASKQVNYGVFIGLAVLIFGYGVFEYRNDIKQKLLEAKTALFGRK